MLSYTKKFNQINIESLIANYLNKNEYHFYWENNKSNQIILGIGQLDSVQVYNHSNIEIIKKIISEKLNAIISLNKNITISPKFFGGIAFNIDSKSNSNWGDFPRGYFMLPKYTITCDGSNMFITLIKNTKKQFTVDDMSQEIDRIYEKLTNHQSDKENVNNNIQIIESTNNITKNDYVKIINKIVKQIENTSLEKVVLSRFEKLKFNGDINYALMIKKMRDNYPHCINFLINLPHTGRFFGSTPERLIKKNNNTIMTEAIAGTIQRDDNLITDKQLEEQLKNDSKNLNEHQLVVDEIKRVLKPQISNIKIPNNPDILKLKNIQHLITKIKGELKDKKHIFELIKILHPTPAVSGYPINKAYQLINKYEQYDRGWYSGPIGWVNAAGDGDFCVALRSALIKNNSIYLFSGGGIVLNSIAENEWKETELKFQTIREIIKDNCNER